MNPPSGWRDSRAGQAWLRYRLRWKRRELLGRAVRARRGLTPVQDRTATIRPADILCFAVIHDESLRLPEFLAHYRRLGAGHFLIVDHDSRDGSAAILRGQPDISLWRATGDYRAARFGIDWLGWLLARHGHGHWCVTVDADELLIYPDWDRRDLHALTRHLDERGIGGMGALLLDLFPTGPLGTADAGPGAPLAQRLPWFDAGPWRKSIAMPRRNRWVQGGTRDRVFFPDQPDRAPTLNKLPLIRWHWRHAYVNSTHSMLPPRLSDLYDGPGDTRLSGALLHSKFLPDILTRAETELSRGQHFADPTAYKAYWRRILTAPSLWHPDAHRFADWQQLVDLGVMGTGDWC